jgi:flagellar hook assembly protein FlgD
MTTVDFVLAKDGPASVRVHDLQGRLVKELVRDDLAAGPHSVMWNGLDAAGRRVGSGVYLVRVLADGASAEHKMVLLK